jgi:hypothetical protein
MTDPAFLELLHRARAEHWCTEPYCATCEPVSFRHALDQFAGTDRTRLATALASMELADWFDVPNAEGAIRIALGTLGSLEQVNRVLEAWLSRLNDQVRIADIVLYRVVRPQRATLPVAERWIAATAEMATRVDDPLLLEHLVFTLREEFVRWPALLAAARRLRKGAPGLHRALQRLKSVPHEA